MKCLKCNQENSDTAKSCSGCGSELSNILSSGLAGNGPLLTCSACSKDFFGGEKYNQGTKNYCWQCLAKNADNISESEFKELGETQRGLVNGIRRMGGTAIQGENYWTTFMKVKAGELPGDALKDSQYSKDPNNFVSEFQRLLHGIREGYFASLENACKLASDFDDPSNIEALNTLTEALSFDDPYLIRSVSKILGKFRYTGAVPALIAAFDAGGYIGFQRRPQIVEGRSNFGSYRGKFQGLCEALLLIGDTDALTVAESQLKQFFTDAKTVGAKSVTTEQGLLNSIHAAIGHNSKSDTNTAQMPQENTNPFRDVEPGTEETETVSNEEASRKVCPDGAGIRGLTVWLRSSDAFLKVPVYLLWNYVVWIIIETRGYKHDLISAAIMSIPQSVVMGLYVYAICNSGPLHWIVEKLSKIPWSGLILNPMVTLPSWVFGWPAEKAYNLFFYKYSCLAMGLDYLQKGEFAKAVFELYSGPHIPDNSLR